MKINNDNNAFYLISKSFSQIQTIDDFEEISFILHKKFSNSNILKINPLVVMSISNSFFGKVICLCKEGKIPDSISKMINFFFDNDFVSAIFREHFYNIKANTLSQTKDKKRIQNMESYLHRFEDNLNDIFEMISTKEKNMRTYGLALLDLKGDFLWCDNKSQDLFELYKITEKNFFDLLIPFSKNLLRKKININKEESREFSYIFHPDSKIGSSVVFSYLVYSHDKLNKFSKFLIKNGIKNEAGLNKIFEEIKYKDTLYNMYLKSLSSRFTLINLRCTKDKLDKLENLKQKEISFFDGEKEIFLKIGEEEINKNTGFSYLNKKRFQEYHKSVILVETRISKKIHNFDFLKMINDSKIKEFQKKILKKLKII